MDEMSIGLDDHKIIIKIKKQIKKLKVFLKKIKTLTKFKETGGLHSGQRSWAPTSKSKGWWNHSQCSNQILIICV